MLIFIHVEHICSFFVAFFSATIDGRNLTFGHKLYIGIPYREKRFWTRQIPTSCLPNSGGYHKWALAHSSSCLSSGISFHLYNVDFGEIKIKYEQDLSTGDWTSLNSCWGDCFGWQPILVKKKIDRFWLWYVIGLSSCLMITQVWFYRFFIIIFFLWNPTVKGRVFRFWKFLFMPLKSNATFIYEKKKSYDSFRSNLIVIFVHCKEWKVGIKNALSILMIFQNYKTWLKCF